MVEDNRRRAIRRWQKANPEKMRQYARRDNQRRHEHALHWLAEQKDKPCMDCHHKFPRVCMDFDHVRGRKLFLLSKAWRYPVWKLNREIKKCDLVCSNCHRIRTERRRGEVVAVYSYECTKCGHKFDDIKPMAQVDEPTECPECKEPANRVVSRPAPFTGGPTPKFYPGRW